MLRSWLFIPGSQKKFLKKVSELKADAFIFDLEDSVPEEYKATARKNVNEAINNVPEQKSFVRVNSIYTDFLLEDLQALVTNHLKGILLPKVHTRDDVIIADYLLRQAEKRNRVAVGTVSIVPLIESAKGLFHSFDIASCPRVKCLAFGAEDFMLDTNMKSSNDRNRLLYARSKIVEVSRAADIESPVDLIFPDLHDVKGLRAEAENGRNIGYQGKLLIHPNQIEIVNEAFYPTAEEVQEAVKIVEYVNETSGGEAGAFEWNGKMLDPPIIERAKSVLEQARRYDK